ncbi:MAG: hypothetical protein WDW36_004958 [Sanguina aurantia]
MSPDVPKKTTSPEDKQPVSDDNPIMSQSSSDEPMDEASSTAYNVWLQRRAAWTGPCPSTARRRPAYIGLTCLDISSEGLFPKPAPLEEVVALLVEEWDDSEDGGAF